MVTRTVIADDHALVRAGLAALLARLPGVAVVGEAADGLGALDAVRTLAPDVVLLDVAMPRLNGLEVLAQIRRRWPATHVVVVSMHAQEEYVLRAMELGAAGYVRKDASAAELGEAMRSVAAGGSYLSPGLEEAVEAYRERTGGTADPLLALTPRQRQVLQLIAEGLTTREVADRLNIRFKTADAHRRNLMRTLGAHDVTALVRLAVRIGLVSA